MKNINHVLVLLFLGFLALPFMHQKVHGQHSAVQYSDLSAERIYQEQIISDVPVSGTSSQAQGNIPSSPETSYSSQTPNSVMYQNMNTTVDSPVYPGYPVSGTTIPDGAVPITEGYNYNNYLRRSNMMPSPDYPRHGYSNNSVTQEMFSAELPSTQRHPETRDEMVPERVGQNPPLKPYPEQESYSYFTNTKTSVSPVCQRCGEGYGNPYLWQVNAHIKILHRGKGDMENYLIFNSLDTPIGSGSSYTVTPGLVFGITRYLGRTAENFDIWLDLTFDGLYHWNSDDVLVDNRFYVNSLLSYVPGLGPAVGPEFTDSNGNTGNLYYPNIYSMKYDSSYNTGEIAFRIKRRGRPDALIGHPNGRWTRECQKGLTYTHLLGVRYAEFDESLDWTGSAYETSIYEAPLATGNAMVDTENNFLGLLFGGELTDKRCIWSWGMKWRFVTGVNMMRTDVCTSSTQAYNLGDGDLYSYRTISHKNDISYQIECGFFATCKIRPHFILRIGYDISFLDRLALVENNLDLDVYGDSKIDNKNRVIMQGLTLGGSFVW
ncbi:MAG: BBP7 family outer membrane beta-barrel protein [Planctomycetia bacterium]|nr:BBP7 family outer membrane beta-barrel protein [Planctomycetia bacterium]